MKLDEYLFRSTVEGVFFGSGITCAVFQKAGITPSRSEVLKCAVKGAASVLALSLRTHAGTLSGPTALFTLICCKAFSVKVACVLAILDQSV